MTSQLLPTDETNDMYKVMRYNKHSKKTFFLNITPRHFLHIVVKPSLPVMPLPWIP